MARDHNLLDEYVRRLQLTRDLTKIMQMMDGRSTAVIDSKTWKRAYATLEANGWSDPRVE